MGHQIVIDVAMILTRANSPMGINGTRLETIANRMAMLSFPGWLALVEHNCAAHLKPGRRLNRKLHGAKIFARQQRDGRVKTMTASRNLGLAFRITPVTIAPFLS